jgi:outer membrane protein assembly factor BamB
MSNKQSGDTAPERSFLSKVFLFVRVAIIGILLAFGVVIVNAVRTTPLRAVYLGLDGLRLPLIIIASTMLLALLYVLFGRPKWKTLLIGSLLIGGPLAAGCYFLRIESFYGSLIPRFTWRWSPSSEEEFIAYQSALVQTEGVAVNDKVIFETDYDHPGFLGRNRDGVVRSIRIDPNWKGLPPRELWRHPVGLGWGGFAVVGQLAVTQEQREKEEAVVCYDLRSGQQLWVHSDEIRFRDEHGDGPRATPTIVDGHVYTFGGTGLLNCLNLSTGELIWQQQALEKPKKNNLLWGMSGSPLVTDQLVIVTPGGGEDRALMAFDRETGALAWAAGDDPAAYASPMRTTLAGRDQFLVFNGAGLRSFSHEGEPLWLVPWITQGEKQRVNVAQPIVVEPFADSSDDTGYVLISSGYSMGMALVKVSCNQDEWNAEEVWQSNFLKSKMSNFVVRAGYIYGFDSGIFTCLNLKTGQREWKRGRYGHGQVLLIDDLLLIQAESGDVVLVEATPDAHRELGRIEALSDKTWNHAALAGSVLVVRNDREAAAYELRLREELVTND